MAVDVFGRVNAGRFAVYAVFIARCRLGGVEAGLEWSDGSVQVWKYATNLNKVLAFRLCDQRLELRGGESVYKTGLGDDEQQDLGTCKHGQFIGLTARISDEVWQQWMHAHGTCCCANLLHYTGLPFGEGDVTTRLVLDKLDVDFSSLTTRLVIVIVIIVSGGGNAWTFDATSVAIAGQRVVGTRAILSVGILNVGHVATG